MQIKELLAQLLADETITDEVNSKLIEAADFDMADYAEQISGYETASGELNTQVAELTAALEAEKAAHVATKALNFDKLVNGNGSTSELDEKIEETEDIESIDDLIEKYSE